MDSASIHPKLCIFGLHVPMSVYTWLKAPVFGRYQYSKHLRAIPEKPMEVYYLDEWIMPPNSKLLCIFTSSNILMYVHHSCDNSAFQVASIALF